MLRRIGLIAIAFVVSLASFTEPVVGAQPAATSGGPVDAALIEDLVAANRILVQEGVLDAFGHVSIRHPTDPNRYLLSRSIAPSLVTAHDIMEYDSFLWVGVPVFEARDARGTEATMLVRNPALGKALATTLGSKPVALMRGHGNVVVGPNVQMAVMRAVYTEINARAQATAISLGGPINYISAEEGAARDKTVTAERVWELWKKVAGK